MSSKGKTVDERVVEMRFDNQQFEQATKTTMSTLDRLKQKLNFLGASKGLEAIDAAAKKVDVSGISSGVDQVSLRFSALQVAAVTVLTNITNAALNTGKRLASAVTLDPIISGFQEYETQIGAIQTILANTQSKGSTLDDVNNALDELNKYADQTIYNFTEMTRNIGTFTAAGVDLDKSVTAIKGIANLAAVSGSTSQQASTAMYQLSQALAAGRVSLMDWNSVVNAGMGGELFQNALKRTAENMGYNVDAMIEKYGSFRESLTQGGWLTAEVLTETLTQISGAYSEADLIAQGYTAEQAREITELAKTAVSAATEVKTFTALIDTTKEALQSGWTQTWEILIGDFEEAKELFTGISTFLNNFITQSADARNQMLQGWKDLGGRTDLLEAFKNIFEGIGRIIKPISEAFREIFPRTTAEQLYNITKSFRELTENFKISDKTAQNLKNTFRGIFSVIKVGVDVVLALAKGAGTLLGGLFGLSGGLLEITGGIGNFVSNIAAAIENTNLFGKVIDSITGFIADFMDMLGSAGSSGANAIGSFFGEIWSTIEGVGAVILETINKIIDALANAFQTGDLNKMAGLFNQGLLGMLILGVRKFFTNFNDFFEQFVEKENFLDKLQGVLDNVVEILDTVKDSLVAWQQNLKAGTLLKIAGAVGILAASIVVLSTIDQESLYSALGALTVLFGELLGSIALVGKINGTSLLGAFSMITMMIGMSTSILILAGALKKVAEINPDKLTSGLLGIAGMAAVMVGIAKALSSGSGAIMKGGTSMVIFAAAMKVMASVLEDLSTISAENIIKGLVTIGLLMTEISIFVNRTKLNPNVFIVSVGILAMATALKVLASATADFGALDWTSITKGLTSIGVLFAELSVATRLMGKSKHIISSAAAVGIMGYSLKVFADIFRDFSVFSWDEISRGLVAIAGSLAAVTFAARGLPEENLLLVSGALPAVTSSLVVLGEAMEKMGTLSWDAIARGIVASAASMLLLVKSLHAMKGVGAAPATLIAASAALMIMAGALSIIGGLGLVGVISSLAGLAGMFVILGGATKILRPLAPSMLSLSVSIAALSVSLTLLGAALAVVGIGSLSFVTSFASMILILSKLSLQDVATGLLTLVAVFGTLGVAATLLKPLAPTILTLSGSLATFALSCLAVSAAVSLLALGLSSLAAVGSEGAQAIVATLREVISGVLVLIPQIITDLGKAFAALILSLVDAIVQTAPAIADGLLKVVTEVLKSLNEYGPQILDFLFEFVIRMINGLADKIPEFVDALANLVGALITALGQKIATVDTSALLEAVAAVGIMAFMAKILAGVPAVLGQAMVGLGGVGILLAELSGILALLGTLAQIPGLNWFIQEGGELLGNVGTAIGKLVGGFAGGVMSGVTDSFPKIGEDLSAFMQNAQPFFDGVSKIDASSLGGVKALADVILSLTASNFIDSISKWLGGGSSLSNFGRQLVPFGEGLRDYSNAVSGISSQAIQDSAIAAGALAELANNLPNTGGIISWFTGNNDIDDFGKMLVPFGEGLRDYSNAVSGIKPDAIESSAVAAKSLSALAKDLPNSGGIISWFTGNNDIDDFGKKLEPFGKSLKIYSDSISGLKGDTVIASATAAKALAALAKDLPNSGGLLSWFSGNNDLDDFGEMLVPFGEGLKDYSDAIAGIDTSVVKDSAIAAKALSELANNLPNSGGLVAWFSGSNNIDDFGEMLEPFGKGLKDYSDAIAGIDSTAVAESAAAAKALGELAGVIPETGGLLQMFTGSADIAGFASQLGEFGKGLAEYSAQVEDINADAVSGSATAVTAIAELSKALPNVGGVVEFFSGRKDLKAFAESLPKLGEGITEYAASIEGIENMDVVTSSVTALQTLGGLYSSLPKIGGVMEFFTGRTDLEGFADSLEKLGTGISKYSVAIGEVKNMDTVSASANALATLATLYDHLPSLGSVIDWLKGRKDLGNFGSQLEGLADGIASYANAIGDIENMDVVTKSVNALVAIASIYDYLPKVGSIFEGLEGSKDIDGFADSLEELGAGIAAYATQVAGITAESTVGITASATAIKDIASIGEHLTNSGGFFQMFTGQKDFSKFASSIEPLGEGIAAFYEKVKGIEKPDIVTKAVAALQALANIGHGATDIANAMTNLMVVKWDTDMAKLGDGLTDFSNGVSTVSTENTTKGVNAVNALVDMIMRMKEIQIGDALGFTSVMNTLNNLTVDGFLANFSGKTDALISTGKGIVTYINTGVVQYKDRLVETIGTMVSDVIVKINSNNEAIKTAGADLLSNFNTGISNNASTITDSFTAALDSCISGIKGYYSSFSSAGSYLVDGFANGISSNTYKAKAKSEAMAKAARDAANSVLQVSSPSRVGYATGNFFGVGFVNGIGDNIKKAFDASANMADYARKGLTNAVSKIKAVLDSGIDTQPTIRPVLDLTDVSNGAAAIGGMLSLNPSVGVLSNIRAINSGMNNQNGVNSDIVSAIKDLKRSLDDAPRGDSYNVNGVTYDDGSNVSDAVQALIRAARIERRK